MIARIQRALCLVLLLLALGWFVAFWPRSPGWALAGLVAPVCGYGAALAAEFVLLYRYGVDMTPRPRVPTLLAAWWAEWRCGMQVFCWRQPFRAHAVPDHLPAGPRRGVLFVHGLVCNRGFWAPWMRRARAMGLPCMAIDLEPAFGPIDAYGPAIDAAVSHLLALTGQPPVVVCHSMGGLAVRAWLRSPGAAGRVAHVVTIGSPHAGTWLARFGHSHNARQMRQRSEWLQALAQPQAGTSHPRFTCWFSDCDNIVFPVSTATLPWADNRFVPGKAHVALAFHPEVMRHTLALV
jgi:triacylglycerol lipase